MGQPDQQFDTLLQDYLARNRTLQRWAWVSVAVPLAIFVFLSVLAAGKARELRRSSDLLEKTKKEVTQLEAKQKELQQDVEVKQEAITIVKQQSPGVRPRVVIYRATIAPRVKAALGELGYEVETSNYHGNPALADKPVDSLEYGCAVTNEDIRTIAAALTRADLPIRRIEPAALKKDPHLVQLVASSLTDPHSAPMSPVQISAWSRSDKPCTTSTQPKPSSQETPVAGSQ